MFALALSRISRQLLLVPIVAVGAYYLMAALPLGNEDEAKRQIPAELLASYERDLGIGQPLGFLRPWEKLFAGERLGTSAQGVTGDELWEKLLGSLTVGAIALGLALVWAFGYALLRISVRRRPLARGASELVPALAFGTPVFIPALLFAPAVVERGYLLPELTSALVISIWPGVFLGSLLAETLDFELRRDYLRTALGKGLTRAQAIRRHVLPNVVPALLDALPPVATSLLAGSFAAERVLGLPYFGQLYVMAVLKKQLSVVVVATTAFAALLVAVTLITEVARLLVDPRAREGGEK